MNLPENVKKILFHLARQATEAGLESEISETLGLDDDESDEAWLEISFMLSE